MQTLPFPHEILLLVFQHLTKRDLLNLSVCSSELRYTLKPYILREVKLDWGFILREFNHLLIKRGQKRDCDGELVQVSRDCEALSLRQFVEKIFVTQGNLQNEWNFNFGAMVSQFANLTELRLTIESSSNFLKYNDSLQSIKKLELSTIAEGSIFNLNHCQHFTKLTTLKINGFCVDFDPEDTRDLPFVIKDLELINCSWSYPFQLSHFGHAITTLQLTYINHQFILSERFREFLHNPSLPNLQYLTISNQNVLTLHITYRIMKFLKNIPNLQRLYLLGKITNETIDNFTVHDLENKVRYVLNVNNVKIFYSSFVDVSKRIV